MQFHQTNVQNEKDQRAESQLHDTVIISEIISLKDRSLTTPTV
jgi:hypothetical protein